MYTDRQLRPVCGSFREWNDSDVARSSVIESRRPPISRSAEIRTALLVPTSIGQPKKLPIRWIRPWNTNCWDSAPLVTKLS